MWAGRTLSGRDRFGWWKVNGIDGWHDSPETKGASESVPNGDGEMDLPTYNEARMVTVTGRLIAKSHADMHEAGIYLTGVMKGRFQESGHGPTQWSDAKRDGRVRFTPITDTLAQWQISLKMVDPVKYGDVKEFTIAAGTGYVNLFHRGNTASLPTIVVSGSAPGGYEIQSSAGARYQVTRALVSGTPHTVDMRDGMLQVGGAYVAGIGVRADVWRIPPGSSATTIRVTPLTTGSPSLTAYVTDSFI